MQCCSDKIHSCLYPIHLNTFKYNVPANTPARRKTKLKMLVSEMDRMMLVNELLDPDLMSPFSRLHNELKKIIQDKMPNSSFVVRYVILLF